MAKTLTHQQMQEKVTEAQKRKNTLTTFCKNNNFTNFEGLNAVLETFYEKGVSEYLDFTGFTKFVGVDDSKENRWVFEALLGDSQKKKRRVETKILILYLLNCIPDYPKEEKLKFAFNLFDEEESKVITIKELEKILQANYFASSTNVVQNKAKIILDEAKGSLGDQINYDDYMTLARKYQSLFYPLNIT